MDCQNAQDYIDSIGSLVSNICGCFKTKNSKDEIKAAIAAICNNRKLKDEDTVETLLNRYLNENATNVAMLVRLLQDKLDDEKICKIKKQWKEEHKAEFYSGESFVVDFNIVFGDKESDILILKLFKTEAQKFPPALLLSKHYPENDNGKVCKFTHEDTELPETIYQKLSEKYPESGDDKVWKFTNDDTKLPEITSNIIKIENWNTEVEEKRLKFNLSKKGLFMAINKETCKVTLKTVSEPPKEGALKSAVMYLFINSESTVFAMVYEKSNPKVFFAKNNSKHSKDREVRHLLECGTTMARVYELLTLHEKHDLKKKIFYQPKKENGSMMEKLNEPLSPHTHVEQNENKQKPWSGISLESERTMARLSQHSSTNTNKDLNRKTFHLPAKDTEDSKANDIVFVIGFLVCLCLILLYSRVANFHIKLHDSICHETARIRYVKERIVNGESNYVIVSGPPESGKSTAIEYTARYLHQTFGYVVHYIKDAREFLDCHDQAKLQVFIFDDPVGRLTLNIEQLNAWNVSNNLIANKIMLSKNTKALFAVRSSILNNDLVASSQYIFNNKSHVVDFSQSEHQLSTDDMRNMLIKHMTKRKVMDIDSRVVDVIFPSSQLEDYCVLSDFFLLKCKYYAQKMSEGTDLDVPFITPKRLLRDIFEDMKNENKYQFCGLLLVSLSGGEMDEDLFKPFGGNVQSNEYVTGLRDRVLNAFALTSFDLKKVQTALQELNDTVRIDYASKKDKPISLILKRKSDVDRLAERIVQDLKENPTLAGKAIVNYPHIDKKILLIRIQELLFQNHDRNVNGTYINSLFVACVITFFNRYYSCYDNPGSNGKVFTRGQNFIDMLLKEGANSIILVNELGYCPIHVSAIIGNKALAKILIDYGRYVDSKTIQNDSVLHLVVQNHHNRTKERKMCSNSTTSSVDIDIISSEATNLAKFFLITGSSVNAFDLSGLSVLHRIIHVNHTQAVSLVNLFLEYGADIHSPDKTGASPLHHTAMQPTGISVQIAEALVTHSKRLDIVKQGFCNLDNKYVNVRDYKGRTPLHYLVIYNSNKTEDLKSFKHPNKNAATEYEHKLQLASLLINNGANVNAYDNDGFSVLHYIASQHSNDAVKLANLVLEHNANINASDNDGKSVLHHIVMNKEIYQYSIQLAELFLKNSIDVNVRDKNNLTAFYYILLFKPKHSLELTKLFLQHDIDLDMTDSYGRNVLQYMFYNGNYSHHCNRKDGCEKRNLKSCRYTNNTLFFSRNDLELVSLLIESGVNINWQDFRGRTALHYVIKYRIHNQYNIIQLLIRNNVDVRIKDIYGHTVLHYLSLYDTDETLSLASVFVEQTIDVNAVDVYGRTALHTTLLNERDSQVALATFLVNHGSDVNIIDNDGRTALHYIIIHNIKHTLELARLLLQNYANVSVADNNGMTALHYAASKSRKYRYIYELATLLIQQGANVNAEDNKGRTAYYYTTNNNQFKLAKLLKRNGAKLDTDNITDITIFQYIANYIRNQLPSIETCIKIVCTISALWCVPAENSIKDLAS